MDKVKFRLTAGFFLLFSMLNTCRCQQSALFNQSPYQRQRQQTLLRQQQQQQAAFPSAITPFGGPVSPITGLNPISQLSPLVPQPPYRTYNQLNQQNYVPITAYQNELNYDGSFAYGYSSADGTTAQAQGYVKNLGLGESVEAQVVQGSYSYTSPEGTPITVRYIADENGFRAEGAHIPTPPPLPDSIANSLQYISGVQQRHQQQQPFQQGSVIGINPNLNPYQTPYRQFSTPQNLRLGQSQQTPLQLQQQQQQNRFFQQQQNTGQYHGDNQFNQQQRGFGGATTTGQQQFGSNYSQQQQQQQQDLQQQQNLTAQRQQHQQQNVQQQQQNEVAQQQQSNAQQQLATQQLQGRSSQLVNPYGYNPYRRYKKATRA